MQVESPVTRSFNTRLEKSIDTADIIAAYQKNYHIDVSAYFKGLAHIDVYQCLDTGYRFYYPLDLWGDDAFYQQMQEFPWYYTENKWEHQIAGDIIAPGTRLLEIGCGQGAFLRQIAAKQVEATGLELNAKAVEQAARKGLRVYRQSIQDHALSHDGHYDVVCYFEVLEHIADVASFINASLQVLKIGGHLIVAVPNNEILMNQTGDVLNMPPHHMGLWDTESLTKLQNVFPVQLQKIYYEPLQPAHYRMYHSANFVQLRKKAGLAGSVLRELAYPFARIWMGLQHANIKGHTILAHYTRV